MAFCFLKKVKIRYGNMEHFILEVTQSPPAFRSCSQPGKKSRGAHEAGKSTHNLLYFPVPTWKELSVNIGKPASLFSFKLLLKRPIGWGLKKKHQKAADIRKAVLLLWQVLAGSCLMSCRSLHPLFQTKQSVCSVHTRLLGTMLPHTQRRVAWVRCEEWWEFQVRLARWVWNRTRAAGWVSHYPGKSAGWISAGLASRKRVVRDPRLVCLWNKML